MNHSAENGKVGELKKKKQKKSKKPKVTVAEAMAFLAHITMSYEKLHERHKDDAACRLFRSCFYFHERFSVSLDEVVQGVKSS